MPRDRGPDINGILYNGEMPANEWYKAYHFKNWHRKLLYKLNKWLIWLLTGGHFHYEIITKYVCKLEEGGKVHWVTQSEEEFDEDLRKITETLEEWND